MFRDRVANNRISTSICSVWPQRRSRTSGHTSNRLLTSCFKHKCEIRKIAGTRSNNRLLLTMNLLLSAQSMKQLEWIEGTTTWQLEVGGKFGGVCLPYGLDKNEVSCPSGCNVKIRKGSSLATSTRIPPSLLRSAKSPHRAKGNQVLLCFSWKSWH